VFGCETDAVERFLGEVCVFCQIFLRVLTDASEFLEIGRVDAGGSWEFQHFFGKLAKIRRTLAGRKFVEQPAGPNLPSSLVHFTV
jgi:hypothetical protein